MRQLSEIFSPRPFTPLRLGMSDGRSSVVAHPEMVIVGATATVIGVPASDAPGEPADYFVTLSNDHITTVKPAAVADRG